MYKLSNLISRLEYLEGKRLSLNQISLITGVHRTVLSRMLHNKGHVSGHTVTKVVTAFFRKFRQYESKLTDEQLYKMIVSELFSNPRPRQMLFAKREINAVKKARSDDFKRFPESNP